MTIILFDFSWGDHFRTIAEIVVVYSGQSSNFYIVNTESFGKLCLRRYRSRVNSFQWGDCGVRDLGSK